MSGQQPGGGVTWDEQAGEYVQWHGRSRDYQAAETKPQPRQTGKDDRK